MSSLIPLIFGIFFSLVIILCFIFAILMAFNNYKLWKILRDLDKKRN